MAADSDIERVWTLVDEGRVCMLSIFEFEDVCARPMTARLDRADCAGEGS